MGFLLGFAAPFSTRADLETLYDLATVNGARLMRLEGYGLAVARRPALVVVAVRSWLTSLASETPASPVRPSLA